MRQNKDSRAATEDCIALMTKRGCGDSLVKIKQIKNTWEV